ncbi:MAG TPA: chemotaxis protein CheB, partial [Vicinamibacterales bacterium]|nr:chemotaxis protein CheB [Vicinamibacterales bacterium]
MPVVGVGASAGGLDALTQLVQALPADSGLVIVVLQHMAADHESSLPYLLARASKLQVIEATQGARLQANCIYVVPPNAQMEISGDRLVLSRRPADRTRHTPIDTFFASLALSARSKAIAIVLSGTGSDGALGIRDIKAAGGITIAQRPETAKYDSMPRMAIDTGMVDLVLSPEEAGAELARIAQHPYVRLRPSQVDDAIGDDNLAAIFDLLKPIAGIDFQQYKQGTIRRRLARRMALNRLDAVDAYIKLLRSSTEERRGLFQDLLIHVTRFFREPESFAALADDVLPKLLERHGPERPLRMWVCGCATGEEAYSLAITAIEHIEKHQLDVRVQIFATDVSDTAIEHARAGIYPATITADVSPARLRRFFVRSDGSYRVSKQIRDLCVFARQDLTKDPPFSRLDLIMCRNVLIYMETALQKRLIGIFHYALNQPGYLVLGHAETVGSQAALFTIAD